MFELTELLGVEYDQIFTTDDKHEENYYMALKENKLITKPKWIVERSLHSFENYQSLGDIQHGYFGRLDINHFANYNIVVLPNEMQTRYFREHIEIKEDMTPL